MPESGGNTMSEHLSLNLSRKLHKLGVVVESKKSWYESVSGMYFIDRKNTGHKGEIFPAPNFAKLWEMMPECLDALQSNRLTMDKYGPRLSGNSSYG